MRTRDKSCRKSGHRIWNPQASKARSGHANKVPGRCFCLLAQGLVDSSTPVARVPTTQHAAFEGNEPTQGTVRAQQRPAPAGFSEHQRPVSSVRTTGAPITPVQERLSVDSQWISNRLRPRYRAGHVDHTRTRTRWWIHAHLTTVLDGHRDGDSRSGCRRSWSRSRPRSRGETELLIRRWGATSRGRLELPENLVRDLRQEHDVLEHRREAQLSQLLRCSGSGRLGRLTGPDAVGWRGSGVLSRVVRSSRRTASRSRPEAGDGIRSNPSLGGEKRISSVPVRRAERG